MTNSLAPYAVTEQSSRGRVIVEPAPKYRSEFQRDRDRIIHSAAFRRLLYKTQVFVNYEGDMYRTRLTHSMEVAQIARTLARALRLNEDLAEAISLAHDLGHTPFGHAGQDALNECMREYGGFEHNLQSLRVVDALEQRYARFSGLNLCYETREGILKHCSARNARQLGDLGERFLQRWQPSLEAQIVDASDQIAYNNHDIDDGLRAGLLTLEQLSEIPFLAETLVRVREEQGDLDATTLGRELVRYMIDSLVTDLLHQSRDSIAEAAPADVEAVRRVGHPLIRSGEKAREARQEVKAFLRQHLYQHARVRAMTEQAEATIRALFRAYMHDSRLLPEEYASQVASAYKADDAAAAARVVADYIAGMTDRFALGARQQLPAGAG